MNICNLDPSDVSNTYYCGTGSNWTSNDCVFIAGVCRCKGGVGGGAVPNSENKTEKKEVARRAVVGLLMLHTAPVVWGAALYPFRQPPRNISTTNITSALNHFMS